MTRTTRTEPVELDMRVVIARIVVRARASALPPPQAEREETGSLLEAARAAARSAR